MRGSGRSKKITKRHWGNSPRADRPSGLSLQCDRRTYTDELAPGEKVVRHRAIRSRDNQLLRTGYFSD